MCPPRRNVFRRPLGGLELAPMLQDQPRLQFRILPCQRTVLPRDVSQPRTYDHEFASCFRQFLPLADPAQARRQYHRGR
jgi:hypothetical protein